MKIELVNGSLWRLVGADSFDTLVGANPMHVTFSEYALTDPKAYEFVRPIIAENGGSLLFITTPRGYNHAHALFEYAKQNAGVVRRLPPGQRDRRVHRRGAGGGAGARCPTSCTGRSTTATSARPTSARSLARYIEQRRAARAASSAPTCTTRAARRSSCSATSASATPRRGGGCSRVAGGFNVIDHDEATGLDAEQWIERLRAKPWSMHGRKLGCVHLPHDARAKTFRSRHTVVTVFLTSQLAERYAVVPQTSIADRINAARVFARACCFNRAACAGGLHHLREWHFKYDEDDHNYTREPEHDEHSHSGDAFSYAAVDFKAVT